MELLPIENEDFVPRLTTNPALIITNHAGLLVVVHHLMQINEVMQRLDRCISRDRQQNEECATCAVQMTSPGMVNDEKLTLSKDHLVCDEMTESSNRIGSCNDRACRISCLRR